MSGATVFAWTTRPSVLIGYGLFLPLYAIDVPVPFVFTKGNSWEYSYYNEGMGGSGFPKGIGTISATIDSVHETPNEIWLYVSAGFSNSDSNGQDQEVSGLCKVTASGSLCEHLTGSGLASMLNPIFEFSSGEFTNDTTTNDSGGIINIAVHRNLFGSYSRTEERCLVEGFWMVYYESSNTPTSAMSSWGRAYELKKFNGKEFSYASFSEKFASVGIAPSIRKPTMEKFGDYHYNILGRAVPIRKFRSPIYLVPLNEAGTGR